jgi:hypothetical protein
MESKDQSVRTVVSQVNESSMADICISDCKHHHLAGLQPEPLFSKCYRKRDENLNRNEMEEATQSHYRIHVE